MTREEITPDDIDEWARLAQGGDRAALEMLLAAVRPRCLAICRGVRWKRWLPRSIGEADSPSPICGGSSDLKPETRSTNS